MNNFAVLTISYSHTATSIIITITTNNPCHLTCYYTDKEPGSHRTSRNQRGLTLPWGIYYCFVAWLSVEQQEPGDTLTHTFEVPDWSYCQTKWFAFRGTVSAELSPSVSAIFKHHHPGLLPYIEEQTLYNSIISIADFIRNWAGQRLTIPGRTVSKLAFVLNKFGDPAGDVTFQILRVSDNSVIVEKVWGSAADLQTEENEQWEEVEFDTPQFIDEEVRIGVYYPDSVSNFRVRLHYQNTDVKADEYVSYRRNGGWHPVTVYDTAYRYTYLA